MDQKVLSAAQVLWGYMTLREPIVPADAILCLGSNDQNVPDHAAKLWHQGSAPLVVMSGGFAHVDDLAATGWDAPEAMVFAERAISLGVPKSAVLIEPHATNTGENFRFSRPLVEATIGRALKRALVVSRPHMGRRGRATGEVVWPDVELIIQSEEVDLPAYLDRMPDQGRFLNQMVGDFRRVIEYPALGYQTKQVVPEEALRACELLLSAGFDRHLPSQPR